MVRRLFNLLIVLMLLLQPLALVASESGCDGSDSDHRGQHAEMAMPCCDGCDDMPEPCGSSCIGECVASGQVWMMVADLGLPSVSRPVVDLAEQLPQASPGFYQPDFRPPIFS